ncbi:MAG: type II toxin-antitoxin system Phd/YefM family antitoxin [Methylocystis sp.]|jgi:antitoxin (DNA-binding transcriptional repressor) of toxin-antitoxin stability system
MSSYTIATAKEHLSRLIDEALAGEPVTITRDGQPVAELRASKMVAEPKPMTHADIDRLRARRNKRPPLGEDAPWRSSGRCGMRSGEFLFGRKCPCLAVCLRRSFKDG